MGARSHWRDLLASLAPLAVLVALGVALAFLTPYFWRTSNLLTVGEQTAVIAVVALGETLVIVSGGIDLSVGSVLGLAGVVAGWLMEARHWGAVGASLAGIATGSLCGLVNGIVAVKARVPTFIVTLGMLGVARGAALVITGGLPLHERAPGFGWLGGGRLAGIPVPLFVVAGLAVLLWLVLERTRLGRYVHAVGGNREAARLSGVRVDRCTVVVFVLAGLCAGLAGVLNVSRVPVASPKAGEGYELDAVAAAVIGGASLAGGEGGIPGTLVGAFLMGVLRNLCNLLNVPEGWQRVIIGVLIVAAVFYDYLRRRVRQG